MPCPRSRCHQPSTFTTEDGTEMQTWFSIRREHLQRMRGKVKGVVIYMALIEALRVGPLQMLLAGQTGYPERGPEDFGIAYYAGYILSWLYLCALSLVWKPLFSWWVNPSSEHGGSKTVEKYGRIAQDINKFLLPLSIGVCLLEWLFFAVMTFIYVDARPVDSRQLPKNNQKNWLARLMLLVGIAISTTSGYAMFQTLAEFGLAHVKLLEYLVIVVPIQINFGILMGSAMQWRMEKRIEQKKLAMKAVEVGTIDEKENLLEV